MSFRPAARSAVSVEDSAATHRSDIVSCVLGRPAEQRAAFFRDVVGGVPRFEAFRDEWMAVAR
ncbi:hypothetical protein [Nocardia miyunensis]|uniref:hypothetical protein n=1 Tax=Nocardia miyunensis TaxID=282684 RepID=UPI000AD45F3E|nr:hypothetical protein [Nocardia miyunensis]